MSKLLAALAVLTTSTLASAQDTGRSGYMYGGNNLTTGDLAVWCIFAVVYIILTVFSALVVIRLPGHRLPYALLFVGSLFTVVQCGANIAYILVSNNLLNFSPIKVQVGLNISSAFFGNWASPFLFLTLALLFADRHATVQRTADGIVGRSNVIFTVLNYAYFGFLMIMATAASGLLATYDLDVQVDDTSIIVTEKFILKLIHDYNVYMNVNYAFLAFFFATTLYIAGCAYYVRRTIHRSTISDRVASFLSYTAVPTYIVGVLTSMIFTIVFSPSELPAKGTIRQIQIADIASDLLQNCYYAAVAAILLHVGMRRQFWNVPNQGLLSVKMQDIPKGGYLELEDPPMKK